MAQRSIWDLLQGQFSPGLPAVNNFVEGLLTPRPPDPDAGEVVHKTKNPLTDITKGDLDKATDMGMAFSGGGLATKLVKPPPPVVGGYHGTPTPGEIHKFIDSPGDLGTHVTVDPGVSSFHANRLRDLTENVARPKTIPVVADVKSAFRFPGDPTDWRNPDKLFKVLEEQLYNAQNPTIPRGMLKDFEKIEKQGWENNFIPAMQEKGFDSILYPHGTVRTNYPKYNSIMTFSGDQVIPRFSGEAQELIKERGIREPYKTIPRNAQDPNKEGTWRMPEGVLKKYGAPDSAVEQRPFFIERYNNRVKASMEAAEAEKLDRFKRHGLDPNDPALKSKKWHELFPLDDLVLATQPGKKLIKTGSFESRWVTDTEF